MAISLDPRARAALERRRAHHKDTTLYLRLEPCSTRAGVPWVLAVGWAPHHWPHHELVVRQVGDAEVRMEPRIARYVQSHDLTISADRFGPVEWLVVSDPFALERMQEWERTQSEGPPPPTGSAESLTRRDLARRAQTTPARLEPGWATPASDSDGLSAKFGSAPDRQAFHEGLLYRHTGEPSGRTLMATAFARASDTMSRRRVGGR